MSHFCVAWKALVFCSGHAVAQDTNTIVPLTTHSFLVFGSECLPSARKSNLTQERGRYSISKKTQRHLLQSLKTLWKIRDLENVFSHGYCPSGQSSKKSEPEFRHRRSRILWWCLHTQSGSFPQNPGRSPFNLSLALERTHHSDTPVKTKKTSLYPGASSVTEMGRTHWL